jgi:histone-binding protein RBBP4
MATAWCRWGGTFDENQYLCRSKLYFSEQTDGSEPQKLIVANVDVMKVSTQSFS